MRSGLLLAIIPLSLPMIAAFMPAASIFHPRRPAVPRKVVPRPLLMAAPVPASLPVVIIEIVVVIEAAARHDVNGREGTYDNTRRGRNDHWGPYHDRRDKRFDIGALRPHIGRASRECEDHCSDKKSLHGKPPPRYLNYTSPDKLSLLEC